MSKRIDSKYEARGAYHFKEYADKDSVYRKHVDSLLELLSPMGETLLDVGAGEGLIAHRLEQQGWKVTAIDFDPKAVELSKNVRLGSAYDLSEFSGQFDVVLLADVLEHFEDPSRVMQQIEECASRKRYLVVATPPPTHKDPWAHWQPTAEALESFMVQHKWAQVSTETRYARIVSVFEWLL